MIYAFTCIRLSHPVNPQPKIKQIQPATTTAYHVSTHPPKTKQSKPTGYDFGPFLFGPHRRPVNKAMLVGTVVGVKQMKRHGACVRACVRA